jgi:hypothetical protein
LSCAKYTEDYSEKGLEPMQQIAAS